MSTGQVYVGEGFRIEWRFLFVPLATAWDSLVPDWLQGRREVVLSRLRNHSAHAVFDAPASSERQPFRFLHSG